MATGLPALINRNILGGWKYINQNTGVFFNDEKLTLVQLMNLICENPAKIFGIIGKGYIKEKYDADLTIVDMNKTIEIKNEKIESKCGWSPFDGYKFKGTPIYTIINGEIKMKDGEILGEASGRPIKFDN